MLFDRITGMFNSSDIEDDRDDDFDDDFDDWEDDLRVSYPEDFDPLYQRD